MSNGNDNGWNEYEKLVMSELRRLSDNQGKMNEKLDNFKAEISTEIAILKMKAGMWGALAGAMPTVAAILLAIVLGWI